MRTAFPAARASPGLYRWNPPGCIRFHVRNKFPQVGLLRLPQLSFRAAWKRHIVLSTWILSAFNRRREAATPRIRIQRVSGYLRLYHAGGLALGAERFNFHLMQE